MNKINGAIAGVAVIGLVGGLGYFAYKSLYADKYQQIDLVSNRPKTSIYVPLQGLYKPPLLVISQSDRCMPQRLRDYARNGRRLDY
jgi:hypothetical protein